MATLVTDGKEKFIIFKTSLSLKEFNSFIGNLMAEISTYTNKKVILTHRILLALLCKEDQPVKIMHMRKAGKDIMDADVWEKDKHVFQHNKNTKQKLLKSYAQFMATHSHAGLENNNRLLNAENATEHDENFMYYI